VKDLLQRLGQRIRDLRHQRGWSQEEFADVCGVHRTYMGHIERGEKNISFSSLARVAGALSVPISDLLVGLEGGDPVSAETKLRVRQKKGSQSGVDREKLLKELAVLERGVRSLKKMALTAENLKKPSV
jgi:transcriptional regulator with XRE-family HTH domain